MTRGVGKELIPSREPVAMAGNRRDFRRGEVADGWLISGEWASLGACFVQRGHRGTIGASVRRRVFGGRPHHNRRRLPGVSMPRRRRRGDHQQKRPHDAVVAWHPTSVNQNQSLGAGGGFVGMRCRDVPRAWSEAGAIRGSAGSLRFRPGHHASPSRGRNSQSIPGDVASRFSPSHPADLQFPLTQHRCPPREHR